MRLHMSQVYVCTAQDVVLCVGQASLPVSCCVVFVAGALRRSHAEGRQPPNPKGWTSRSRRTSWAPVQRESRTVRPISLAFLGVQQTVGRQSTRASPVDRAASALVGHRRLHPFGESVQMWTHAPASASPRLIKRLRCRRVDRR